MQEQIVEQSAQHKFLTIGLLVLLGGEVSAALLCGWQLSVLRG